MADRPHYFHAEAHALTGKLERPFAEEIKKQAFVKLMGRLGELSAEEQAQRSYFSQHGKNFRLEGIVSYSAAHTQVAGHSGKKDPRASITLATSVIEDLNVLNVVTADRVVAQITATYVPDEQAPRVTFLGTHFENLRIFRHRVFPKLNLKLGRENPATAQQHFIQGAGFQARVRDQYAKLAGSVKELKTKVAGEPKDVSRRDRTLDGLRDLPAIVERDYNAAVLDEVALRKRIDALEKKTEKEGHEAGRREWRGVNCSLVEHLEIDPPSREQSSEEIVPFGHVIFVPDFGKIFLADLSVSHNTLRLTMIRLELGCVAHGTVEASVTVVNGGGSGGH